MEPNVFGTRSTQLNYLQGLDFLDELLVGRFAASYRIL